MAKNGLLFRLQRRLLLADKSGAHFQRTAELAELVADTVKTREPGQDPATRTFQALRIFINAELEELATSARSQLEVLAAGGRLVVISFHSLEDRIVKQFIAKHSHRRLTTAGAPFAVPQAMKSEGLWSRMQPSGAEVAANPRARSAIMRVAAKDGSCMMPRSTSCSCWPCWLSACSRCTAQYESRRLVRRASTARRHEAPRLESDVRALCRWRRGPG